jgi:hypothetical protein
MTFKVEGLGTVEAEFTYTRAEAQKGRGAPLTAYCAMLVIPEDPKKVRLVQGHQVAFFENTPKETLRKGALTVAIRNAKLTKDQRRHVWEGYFSRGLAVTKPKTMAAA